MYYFTYFNFIFIFKWYRIYNKEDIQTYIFLKKFQKITEEKGKYIKNRELSNDMYKQMIVELIKIYGKATRYEINDLLLDKILESKQIQSTIYPHLN